MGEARIITERQLHRRSALGTHDTGLDASITPDNAETTA
jgi:hypothetical protein